MCKKLLEVGVSENASLKWFACLLLICIPMSFSSTRPNAKFGVMWNCVFANFVKKGPVCNPTVSSTVFTYEPLALSPLWPLVL